MIVSLASLLSLVAMSQSLPDEAVVDLAIVSARIDPLVRSGEGCHAEVEVRNAGDAAVDAVSVTVQCGERVFAAMHDEPLASDSTAVVGVECLLVTTDALANMVLPVTATTVGSRPDATPSDNVATLMTNVYTDGAGFDVPRGVLMEQFSTELCSNCPSRDRLAGRVLADYSCPIVRVTHHTAFHYDRFTVGYSEEIYPFFYNSPYVYAPAVMLGRKHYDGMLDSHGGYSPGPVFRLSETNLRRALDDQAAMPNFVSMQISTTVDETAGELRINVSGRDLLVTSGQVINVFITEDGIRSDSQAGSDTTWTHNHVLREVLTPVWGAPLDVGEDGNYSFDAVWEIKDEITGPHATTPVNLANINVVAFIGNHDAADPNRCEVFNAAVADKVFSSSTGIGDAAVNASVTVDGHSITVRGDYDTACVYGLGGVLVTELHGMGGDDMTTELNPGLYIIQILADDKPCVQKVIVR